MLNASSPPPGRSKCIHFCWSNVLQQQTEIKAVTKPHILTGSLYKETKNGTNFNSFKKMGRFDSKCLPTSLEKKCRFSLRRCYDRMSWTEFRPMVLSLGICPSGWMPCSKQKSSQQALPIWTPPWAAQLCFSMIHILSNHVRLYHSGKPLSFLRQHDLARLGIYTCKWLHDWLRMGSGLLSCFCLIHSLVLDRTPSSLRFLFFFTQSTWCHFIFIAAIFINENENPTTSAFFIFLPYLF